jgi:hypothetical protein
MAKEYQPILNQQGFNPNSGAMVDRLKGSASMVDAVTSIGKLAIEGGEQYANLKQAEEIASVKGQVQEALRPVIQQALEGSPSTQFTNKAELNTYEDALEILPTIEGGSAEQVNDTISMIQSGYQKRIDYLSRAKSQGRITADAFDQNVRAITKKYISDNPALRDEIIMSAKNTLEDEGILEVIKRDESDAQTDAKIIEEKIKDLREDFRIHSIPEGRFTVNGRLDINRAQKAVDIAREAEASQKAFTADLKIKGLVTEEEAREVAESGIVPMIVLGQYQADSAELANIFTQNATDFPKAKLQATAFLQQQLAAFKTNPNITRWAGNQIVKDGFADYEKRIEALSSAMQSFASLEDLQKFTQASKDIMSNQQSINLMRNLNVPAIELFSKIAAFGNLINSTEGTNFTRDILLHFRDILGSGKLNGNSIFKTVPGTNQTGMSLVLQQSVNAIDQSKPDTVKNASQVISANIDAINDPNISPNPTDQILKADTFFIDMGKPEFIEKFIDMDPNSSNKFLDLLNKYNGQIDQELQKYIRNPDKTIKLEIIPSTGMLVAQGADQAFNSMFTSRINNSLKAYANLRVQKPSEVFKDFYEEYFPGIVSGKSYANEAVGLNNPLNSRDSQGKTKQFNSLQESVSSFEKLIVGSNQEIDNMSKIVAQEFKKNLRLYENKKISKEEYGSRASSLNKAFKSEYQTLSSKPTSIRTIVDRFYKDSNIPVTQEDREKASSYLADLLTKSPNTPLDLNDKELIAKLYTGFASLETGTDNIEWLRVSSLLKMKYKTSKEKREEKERMTVEQKAKQEYSDFENQMEKDFPSRSK